MKSILISSHLKLIHLEIFNLLVLFAKLADCLALNIFQKNMKMECVKHLYKVIENFFNLLFLFSILKKILYHKKCSRSSPKETK